MKFPALLLVFLLADASPPVPGPPPLRGTVRVVDPPPRRRIRFDVDPGAAAMHAEPVFAPDAEVDGLRRVRWAFVSVKGGLEGKTFPVPRKAAVLSHERALYTPFVMGLRAGQDLEVRNGDDILHNTHARAERNPPFNFSQPVKVIATVKRFALSEPHIQVKCDVHPWESCWVFVLDHPHFAVTGPDGGYEMPGLPPGEYAVEVWHPRYAPVTQTVRITGRGATVLDFTLAERR